MRQFKLFSLWFFLSLISVSLSVLFPLIAGAAIVGFYAGAFDPPTQAELGIVRCALGDASSHKECQEIGKAISRVVVVVNQAGDANYGSNLFHRSQRSPLQSFDKNCQS